MQIKLKQNNKQKQYFFFSGNLLVKLLKFASLNNEVLKTQKPDIRSARIGFNI